MNRLTNTAVAARVRRAAESAAPDRADEIWSRPITPAAGGEWYLEGTATQKKETGRSLRAWTAVAAAALALVILAAAMLPNILTRKGAVPTAFATVYLDVNPSIELRIDEQQRVISAEADNADGEKILDGMDLSKTDVDVALNAILGAMVRQGYLTETKNVLLLSVESGDTARAAQLQKELSAKVNECLRTLNGSGLVLSRSVHISDEANALARKHGITPGKAALILELTKDWPNLDLEDLAELPMTDLVRLLTDENVNLRDYLEWDEEDQEWDFEWDDRDDDDDDDEDDVDDDDDDHDDADDDDHDDHDDHDDADDADDDDDHDDDHDRDD